MPRVLIGQEIDGIGVIDDLQVSGSSSSSFSVTDQNGVKTTRVVDDRGKRIEIVEDPASGITCKVTKNYGPKDLAKLEDEQPELFMHLSAIPKTVDNSQVEISVGVTTTYSAADKDELESKHPDVFKLYAKYTDEKMVPRMPMRRALRLRLGPDGGALLERDDGDDDDVSDDESDDDDDDESDDDDGDDDESDDDDEGDGDSDDDDDDR